jgi:N-methylhydantoinase A/oxoprolinase/acetone carboxylase beta subunit
VWFEGGWREARVHQRDALVPGMRFIGPAIVEQIDATTVIEPGQAVEVDHIGNLVIDVRQP